MTINLSVDLFSFIFQIYISTLYIVYYEFLKVLKTLLCLPKDNSYIFVNWVTLVK